MRGERAKDPQRAPRKAIAKAPVAPMAAGDAAILDILEAVCGYARQEGRHLCKRESAGQGTGCEPGSWVSTRLVVEHRIKQLVREVIEYLEPGGRVFE